MTSSHIPRNVRFIFFSATWTTLKFEFQNPKSDSELTKLIENFINSSGGSYSLVSARELNDEPKCLLSGDFLCSEVVANSSAEVVEYFKQAMRKEFEVMTLFLQSYVICVKSLTDNFELKWRTRESLGINIAGLFTLYRNGHTLNFLISPPKSTSKNINIYSKAFFIILSGSSLGMYCKFPRWTARKICFAHTGFQMTITDWLKVPLS